MQLENSYTPSTYQKENKNLVLIVYILIHITKLTVHKKKYQISYRYNLACLYLLKKKTNNNIIIIIIYNIINENSSLKQKTLYISVHILIDFLSITLNNML